MARSKTEVEDLGRTAAQTQPTLARTACPVGACAHCRAPLTRTTVADAEGALYCCTGCRSARALITSSGLDRYYDLARGQGQRGDGDPVEMPWLDATVEVALARPGARPERLVLDLDVQGLHCAACVWVLQALFKRHEGAHHLLIDPGVGRLRLTIDQRTFPLADYLAQCARLGYRSGPPSRDGRAPSDGLGLRLGLTIAIAMNAMAVSLATYFGLEDGDPDGLYQLFGWVNLGLASAAMIIAAPVFFRGAFQALRHRTLHLDVPIALGVLLAYLGSVGLFLGGHPEHAYFDTLDTFLALMLLGRWAQRRTLDRNRRLLLADDGFSLARVKVVAADGQVTHRPLVELRPGMRFLVAPGELVPVAADLLDVALHGPASMNLAWVSGESEPVLASDRPVPAGAHLLGGVARLCLAREPFSSTALSALLAAPSREDSAAGATSSASDAVAKTGDSFWHHLTTGWVVTVLLFAALTALRWIDSPLAALHHATAVLVVTCPCAIGLATPLAYELAHLRLRRMGLLSRRAGLLDRARRLRHVVFDKTGTLTFTTPVLRDRAALTALTPSDRDALWQLAARSNHPKSRALIAALDEAATSSAPAGEARALAPRLDPTLRIVETPGVGLASDTHRLASDGLDLVLSRLDATQSLATPLARFAFDERLRADAPLEVARLQALGLTVHIASGDAPDKVLAIARHLGVAPAHTHARLLPEAKAALVRSLGAAETLVLGDGVNDVLAFEAAGLAGTPALDRATLPARADFVLIGQDLGPLAELVALGRRTRRITWRNLVIAAVYNATGLVAGLLGALTPLIAAVAMPLSSLIVLGLTLWAAHPGRDPLASLPTEATPTDPLPPRSPTWMPST